MAYKIPLKTFGRSPEEIEAEYNAKLEVKTMSSEEVRRAIQKELRESPHFDYREMIALIVAEPIVGTNRGNSGADIRTINRIIAKVDADKSADHVLLEDKSDYSFLAERVAAYTGWGANSPAMNKLIEQFLDEVAKAEKVDVVEKKDEKPPEEAAPGAA